MGNPNVGIQGVNSAQQLKRVRTDDLGRLLIGSAGAGIASLDTLITAAPAYSIGDNVGGEIAIFPTGAELAPLAVFRLDSLTLVDPAAQSANLMVLYFAAGKAAHGATITDNAAFAYGAGTRAALLGGFEVKASDWVTVAGTQIATLSNLSLALRADVNSTIYLVVQCLGAPNFGNGFLYVKSGMTRVS